MKAIFPARTGALCTLAHSALPTVLDTTSEGPWLLTRLPAGNYKVVATLTGNPVTRQVAVGATGLRTVDFRWASE